LYVAQIRLVIYWMRRQFD